MQKQKSNKNQGIGRNQKERKIIKRRRVLELLNPESQHQSQQSKLNKKKMKMKASPLQKKRKKAMKLKNLTP